MSVKRQKRNAQTPVAVNEEASAALQQLRTEQEQFLRRMDNTFDLDGLRHRVGNALAVLRGFPEYVREEDLPEDCPGWGRYTINISPCGLCQWNLACMTAEEERTE
jgi:hypothetical protein